MKNGRHFCRPLTLMLATLLCGCGLAEAGINETGFPIVDEPITVTAWGIIHPSATEGWEDSVFSSGWRN